MPLISCAASLVTHRFFVTAGHCIANLIPKRKLHSRTLPDTYGDWQEEASDWTENSSAYLITNSGQRVPVKAFLLHPEYKSFFSGPDVAILDVGWSNYNKIWDLEPICLMESKEANLRLNLKSCYSAGWGYAKNKIPVKMLPKLPIQKSQMSHNYYWPRFRRQYSPQRPGPREIQMPVNPIEKCRASYKTHWLFNERHICAGIVGSVSFVLQRKIGRFIDHQVCV
ncbi:hypothetical protein Ciccas_014296 [Cichlidogyrus casuarinus]|uniref:Peptidase S1 domain-containing protein n=1 Tax=Cichlidogyrus casuarinus TaxID=1844966 RepID=A0ABD2PKN2_9PLAT